MHHGFIKVASATPALQVAGCAYNTEQLLALMAQAAQAGVRLLVFPELAITGYTCGDLFLQRTLLEGAVTGLRAILQASRDYDMLVVAGLPLAVDAKLYNTAAVCLRGRLLGLIPTANLPPYHEFYEGRLLAAGPAKPRLRSLLGQEVPFGSDLIFCCNQLPAFRLGVEICEDLWVPQPRSSVLALAGATVIANPSASNETIGKAEYRRQLVLSHSARLVAGYVYADAGADESTTDLVFSGHNLIAENGVLLAQSEPFSQGLLISELDVDRLEEERRRQSTYPSADTQGFTLVPFDLPLQAAALTRRIDPRPFVPGDAQLRAQRCESIFAIQAMGLKKRIAHTRCRRAVIGISGGLDSCLALLVSVRAMDLLGRPRSDVLAVTMPCFGTTRRTRSNAELLCQQLGVSFDCVDISESVRRHLADIGHSEQQQDVTYENAQARERTQVLMDIANRENGLVVGTGDLSELALGWATYNGDHMSMYGVNASIPKTLVRHMVQYAADTAGSEPLSAVLNDILNTPVSPELLPAQNGEIAQKTEDIVGPYALHDFFLYYMMRFGFTPGKIYRLALAAFQNEYSPETVLAWLRTFYRRFFSQQFKRSCLPDGPKVGSVALSPRGDWRMPSDASAALWLAELDKLK